MENPLQNFNPSGVGLQNGQFIGLPYSEADARVVLLPAPWDVTVSSNDGTAAAAQNILDASAQLDLFDPFVADAWKMGIYMRPLNQTILEKSQSMRPIAKSYISFLESGGKIENSKEQQLNLIKINEACESFKNWVSLETEQLLEKGKLVGLVGGDHSTPLGFLETLSRRNKEFGILHFDAHFDLRNAYEGFTYSHASIFYNALRLPQINKLVSVGIRDYCDEEIELVRTADKRIKVFYDYRIRENLFEGETFNDLARKLSRHLPKRIYISFDIDVLLPYLCPNTGTPVPGGMEFNEVLYLIRYLVENGHKIIGFDLSEVAGMGHEWDGNVAARLLYRLSNLMGRSNSII